MPLDGTVWDTRIVKNKDKKANRRRRPTAVNGTVPPKRRHNRDVRPREYLTPKEVERLIDAAQDRDRRYGQRDATMILIAFRHGLRVAELCSLTWDQIEFSPGRIHVRRVKQGLPSVHELTGKEMRALRTLKRKEGASRYVFMTERGAPMSPAGFRKMLARLGEAAAFPFRVHPHMLRHGCGYKLANDGRDTRALQSYLGHKNIMHTVRYTELASDRFKNFWED